MAKHSKTSTEDSDLFRRSIGPVRKLSSDRAPPGKKRPAPRPRARPAQDRPAVAGGFADSLPADEVGASDVLFFARPGLQKRLLLRLRRGQLQTGDELDLHGMTAAAAQNTLARFLAQSRERRLRCVSIIHGKGYGSKNSAPVLKNKLNNWLRQDPDVLAFCSSRPDEGGTGAVYVLLRSNR